MARKQKQTNLQELFSKVDNTAIGLSSHYWELLKSAAFFIGDECRTVSEIVEGIGVSQLSVRFALNRGRELGVFHPDRKFNGAGGGCKPTRWSNLLDGFQALPSHKKDSGNRTKFKLTKPQKLALERVDWKKTGLKEHDWRRLAHVCAAVGSGLITTYPELAVNLGIGQHTLRRIIDNGKALGIFKVVARYGYGPWPRRPSEFSFELTKLAKFARGQGRRSDNELLVDFTPQRIGDRSVKVDRLNASQRRALDRIDWKRTGMKAPNHWLAVKLIITAVGSELSSTYYQLAVDMGISQRTLHVHVERSKKAGLFSVKSKTSAGSRFKVNWLELEALAGFKKKTASNVKVKMVKKKAVKFGKGGQKPDKRNLTCEWIENWRIDNPENSLEQARRAYVAQFPQDIISLDALKKAIRRRRSNAV